MARYKVLEPTFDNATGVMLGVGDEIEFGGIPGENLEPIDAEAKRAAKDAPQPQEPAVDLK